MFGNLLFPVDGAIKGHQGAFFPSPSGDSSLFEYFLMSLVTQHCKNDNQKNHFLPPQKGKKGGARVFGQERGKKNARGEKGLEAIKNQVPDRNGEG